MVEEVRNGSGGKLELSHAMRFVIATAPKKVIEVYSIRLAQRNEGEGEKGGGVIGGE